MFGKWRGRVLLHKHTSGLQAGVNEAMAERCCSRLPSHLRFPYDDGQVSKRVGFAEERHTLIFCTVVIVAGLREVLDYVNEVVTVTATSTSSVLPFVPSLAPPPPLLLPTTSPTACSTFLSD
jgi:hypothetical protein